MDEKKQHHRFGWVTWLLLLSPVLYVASFGPATRVVVFAVLDNPDPDATNTYSLVYSIIYGPLLFMAGHSVQLARFLEWYAQLRGTPVTVG